MSSCIAGILPPSLYNGLGSVVSTRYEAPATLSASREFLTHIPIEKYQVIRPIQEGSVGRVYLAKDCTSDKKVALKKVRNAGGAILGMLQKEVRIQQAVQSHPNIAKAYDFTHDAMTGEATIALEYCGKGDLIDMVRPDAGMDTTLALKYALQVAQAVAHMHDLGYAHRDIKSENVCVDEQGNAKLIDFGFAMHVDDRITHRVAGTTPYVAPEFFNLSIATDSLSLKAGDVWSFGIMLFSILTGRFAWRKATHECREYSRFAFRNMSSRQEAEWARIPSDVRTLLVEIFAADASKRPTMAQVCDRIQQCMSTINTA